MTEVREFQATVWGYYAQHAREMPWRTDHSPYRVLVSELMLQQTQAARVIPKFEAFMDQFPNVQVLADAPLDSVIRAWQGLGYNRRARFLHEAAKMIVAGFGGAFPPSTAELTRLPGVGKNTAGAIVAYAFDEPVVFVETNIRTVLFHHFFDDAALVDDRELLPLVRATLPSANIREWYWALMDYGTHLKRTAGSRLDVSRHYKKQAPLKGSVREVRGQIVRTLADGSLSEAELRSALHADDRFDTALTGLIRDGLVTRDAGSLRLTA